MKTFTNYAEKKEKQLLNLLQGYTKGIRMTAILILLLMGVNNTWAKDIYVDMSSAPNWYDNAHIHYWDGSSDQYVKLEETGISKLLKATINNNYQGWRVCRYVDGVRHNDCTWISDKNVNKFKVNSSGNGGSSTTIIGLVTGGHIYFDNSTTDWQGNIQFVIGHNGYSRTYEMTQIENTQLWYVNLTDKANHTWGDATYYGFIASSDKFGDGTWGSGNLSKASKYTAAYTSTYSLNDGGTYYCKPSSATNGKSFTITYVNGYNAISKYNATQAAKLRDDINSSYTTIDGSWPTTLKLKGTHLNGNGSSDRNEISGTASTNAESNRVYGAVVTGLITHSYPNLSDDYQFDGWIKGSGTSLTSTNPTYSYNITAATTVYACFTKKYEVTFGTPGNGSITATAGGNSITSETKVVGGSEIIFTASPSPGYRIQGWYSDANCTSKIAEAGTSETYTITSLTGAKTIYVKYEEIPEEKYTVKISTDGNGTVDLSASEQIGKSGKSITATPNEGFDFDHWAVDGGATVADEKAANTTITATKDGSVTAYFKEIMRTISVTCNNALCGTVSPTSTKAGIATPSENITATPAEGYELKEWRVTSGSNNITLSSTTATTIQVTQAKVDGSISATFQEKKYNITVLKDGKTSTTQQIGAKTQVSITAATLTGFEFVGWVVSDEQTPGCITIDDPTKATIKVTATGTGTITATFRETGVLYFKNNLGWSEVYVYFHTSDSYWDATLGSGSYGLTIANGRAFKMERIGNTDIYKCHYGAKGTVPTNSLAFTPENKQDNKNFWRTKASYRTDFNSQMELFIPQNTKTETKNETDYYNRGVWMKYNSTESGYDWRGATSDSESDSGWATGYNFTASKPGGYTFKASVTFNNTNKRFFKIHNTKGDWFGNGGNMTQTNCTNWTFGADNGDNATITPTVTGTYIFTIYLGDGEVKVSLDYPLSTGDYRLVYVDDVTGAHPGHYIKKRNEDRLDTVSFFVHHQNSPRILLQHCTAINSGVPTWKTDEEYQILKTGGADPTSAQLPGKRKSDAVLHVGEGCGIEESGVYNFVLQQSNSQAELFTDATHPYVGNFYIRTDAAAGGWDAFRQAGNKMTYSSYADKNQKFDHYFCSWFNQGNNVKFVIANDYSLCISDTLDGDDIINKTGVSVGSLPADANVRYAWDSKTNELSRAYIAGSSTVSHRFLVLTGNEDLKDINGNALNVSGLNPNEAIFSDKENWIYQLDVQANNNTEITLTAQYNDNVQTFFSTSRSGDGGEPIMQATNNGYHKVRMIYDFKTNNLIAAWLLNTPVQETEAESVASNMLIIRENQGDANQINFTNNQKSMEIYTAYAVMTFTKEWVKGENTRDRSEYWVSFPFDVNISDVFGFSEYGDQWIMQLYDGAERAEKGNWIDSPTFWKYITNRNYTLKAGVGYVLKLNPSKMTFDHGATDVSLFFPSQGTTTIINAEPTPITVPAHTCTIERDSRDIKDSHWNLIGVPGYANLNEVNTKYTTGNQADGVNFYYAYDAQENKYAAAAATATFKNMHAYMVQFAGTINWKNDPEFNTAPQQLAARRNSDAEPEKRTLRLEIAQGEEVADQTFVQLQQEGATPEFDMNLDLTKIINSGANIYTLAGEARIQVAGNALPVAETTIPVGVQMATAGEYTFRMPNGTEGMVVELIDYETNTRTNLLLSDYTTTLPAGSFENRFALIVKPDKVATDVENIGQAAQNGEAAKKYIIDGKLYLQKGGLLYDAQGHIVR